MQAIAAAFASDQTQYQVVLITHSAHQVPFLSYAGGLFFLFVLLGLPDKQPFVTSHSSFIIFVMTFVHLFMEYASTIPFQDDP